MRSVYITRAITALLGQNLHDKDQREDTPGHIHSNYSSFKLAPNCSGSELQNFFFNQ